MFNRKIVKFFIIYNILVVVLNLVNPVIPTLIKNLHMPNYMFGILYSSMSFTLFLFSTFWGKVSDFLGRVNVISISLVGYALGQFLFLNSHSEFWLVVSRLVAGMLVSGQSVCAIAYLVDISEKDNKARNITLFTAVASLCSAFGFLIGGLFGDISIKIPFFVQITLLLLLAICFKLFIKDEINISNKINIIKLFNETSPLKSFYSAKNLMTKKLFIFLCLTFLCFCATTAYDNSFNFYVKDVLNFPPSYNGAIKFSIGIVGLFINCTLNLYIAKKMNLHKVVPMLLMFCSVMLFFVFLSTNTLYFIVFNMAFYIFNIMYMPHLQTLIISKDFKGSTGILAGTYNSVKGLGMILGGLLAGFLYNYNERITFFVCCLLFFVATILGIFNILKTEREKKDE